MDGPVRHDDRRKVVLEERGQSADWRFVTGYHRDCARQPGGAQMLAERLVRRLPPELGARSADVAIVYSG